VSQRNFVYVLIIFLAIALVGGVIFFISDSKSDLKSLLQNRGKKSAVSWQFDQNSKAWQVSGTPPACPEPLVFPSPVDVNLASAILYPGQERGGDYKPHGGFRFDSRDTNDVEVRAIMDGVVLKASKYVEFGEEQISLFYVNDCGIMVMHDHFLTLSPKLQSVLAKVPLGKEGDSRTTNIEPKAYIKRGEVLATEVGSKNFNGHRNIGVDFGLYDLRKTNGVVYDSSFRARFPVIDEYGTHAVCWLDYLEQSDKNIVKSLSGADGKSGTRSDYCK
jgi:hypothetical protein